MNTFNLTPVVMRTFLTVLALALGMASGDAQTVAAQPPRQLSIVRVNVTNQLTTSENNAGLQLTGDASLVTL